MILKYGKEKLLFFFEWELAHVSVKYKFFFFFFFSTQVMYYRASHVALMVRTWLSTQEMKETQAWSLGQGRFLGGGHGKIF